MRLVILLVVLVQRLCQGSLVPSETDVFGDETPTVTSTMEPTIQESAESSRSFTKLPFPEFLSEEIQKAMDDSPRLFEETNNSDQSVPGKSDELSETDIRQLCAKVAEVVKNYCIPGSTKEFFVPRCEKYFEAAERILLDIISPQMPILNNFLFNNNKHFALNDEKGRGLGCGTANFQFAFLDSGEFVATDCGQYVRATDPLYAIANAFNSGVGINFGTVGINGIPSYPINKDGAIEIGSQGNIPFGTWGGGYAGSFGVRDFWSQFAEFGGNWYEGKYGVRSGWSVPLVQSLGVEGNSGVGLWRKKIANHSRMPGDTTNLYMVSIPIKKGDLGKPIAVDIGGGVGPYYQQNNHIGVDWLNGGVQQNFGLGVPLLGFGVNSGWGFKFPSVSALSKLSRNLN